MAVEITMCIREARKAKGMTIAELSMLSGVSISYISEVENGKYDPTLNVMCSLALALDVKLEELFTYELKK